MIGLLVLGAIGLYLLISVLVVRWAIRHARANGKSAKRWGWGAALGMYLLVFWDWIPTVAVHQYYCAADSGFWVYKTLDQWKVENPEGLEKIEKENKEWAAKYLEQWKVEHPNARTDIIEDILKKNQVSKESVKPMPYGDLQTLNERFAIETRRRTPIPLLSTKIAERLLVDRKTGAVLAKGISVGSSYGNLAVGADSWQAYKFWLRQEPCVVDGIWNLSTEIQNMRGKK